MNTNNVQPLATFENLEDPDYFYNYVTQLLDTNLPLDYNELITSKQEIWVTVLLGLSQFMVFPQASETLSWTAFARKVEMVEKWMELIERASTRIVGLYSEPGNLAEEVLTKLLGLSCAFWAWDGHQNCDSATYTPLYMREKTLKVMLIVVRALGDSVTTAPSDRRLWQTLRMFLVECLDVIRDFASGPATLTPSNVKFFKDASLSQSIVSVFEIKLHSPSYFDAFLLNGIEAVSQTLCLPMRSKWFFSDLLRLIPDSTRLLFDFYSSPSCLASSDLRRKLLNRVVMNVIPFYRLHPGFCGPLKALPYRLLQYQLRSPDLQDTEVKVINEAQMVISASRTDIVSALQIVRTEPLERAKAVVLQFICNNIPFMDSETLDATTDVVTAVNLGSHRDELLSRLESRRNEIITTDVKDGANNIMIWMRKVQALIEDLYVPDHILWSDEEESASEDQFAYMALHRLRKWSQRPLPNADLPLKVSFAKKLATLVCLLCRCDSSQCSVLVRVQSLPMLSFVLDGVVQLLHSPDATSELRRLAFAALTRVIRHNAIKEDNNTFDGMLDFIFPGLTDRERSVRLSAGNALAALIHVLSANGSNIEPIFDRLYRIFDGVKIPVKESLIISVGQAGKSPEMEIVGQSLCFLIAQLGSQNPVLKGSAYMKIDNIKQVTGKSVYSLLGRHIDRVAPFLVTRYYTQPGLLTETCRLMGMSAATFISMTRQQTYPQLFGSCDTKVLQSIARVLEVPVSALYLQEAPQILAHVFQLQGPGQTKKAIEFIERMVATDLPGSVTVTIQDLLKSSQVQTLAEIIIELGHAHKTNAALAALSKLQQALASVKQNRSQDLATFLKPHTLGVFSQLSDFLQEVKVKVSIERKQTILRSMGALARHVGKAISDYAPQYMSTFQTMVIVEELSEVTLETWHVFLTMLEPDEIKPYVGPTTAAFIFSWGMFNINARGFALQSLEYLIIKIGEKLDEHLDDVVDLSTIPELAHLDKHLKHLRREWIPEEHLRRILSHCVSDNLTVAVLSIDELKRFLIAETQIIRQFASGDVFDPMVGQIMTTLIAMSCRDGDGTEPLRLLAFECIGILGALDPDRLEVNVQDPSMIVLNNFTDEEEAILFAMHLIRDLLVGVFRATNDVVYQRYLGSGSGGPPSTKARNRWKSLPKHVVETLISLLDSKYSFHPSPVVQTEHPIYPTQSTYREWIQIWTCHLIDKASGPTARNIFASFPPTVRNKDVVVAYHILPHLVLNILISGHDDDAEAIRIELKTVLEDQINLDSSSAPDKKLLSAQAVFMIMDHISKWVRMVRQNIGKKKGESKRARDNQIDSKLEEQLLRVDSILSSIDQILIARAAFQCKAYARSLMSFERQIVALQEQSPNNEDLPGYYERLHEIYSHLDEPDGMEGVSTLILSPSLEHQIRQHESTGRWTSAQSCWEVRLQQSPDNVDFHIGLLRCLRNLGHYDTLRTHVKGVLIRHPEWEAALAGFHVESAWMVGAWDEVQDMIERTSAQSSSIVMARLLLAMRAGDSENITKSISVARSVLGAPITAAGTRGYRRSYEAVLDLHLMHELEIIQDVLTHLPSGSQTPSQNGRRRALASLSETLTARFVSTLPTFRTREPILSLRRTAFALSSVPRQTLASEHGRSWLTSAAIARKAGHWQTAYSAMLQATQNKTKFSFFESAKLIKALGEPLRALTELENSMKSLGMLEESSNVVDLTQDDDEMKCMKAKASHILKLAHPVFDISAIFKVFTDATQLRPEWESAHFYLGQFHDECFKNLSVSEQGKRGVKMNLYTVRSFAKAIKFGSKYVYQTVPRLLTIWLDLGDDKAIAGTDVFKRLNENVSKAIADCPAYKWYTAFPQIVSRVGHSNPEVYTHLSKLIVQVLQEYPKQGLWLFTSVVKSTKPNREQRGKQILKQLQNNPNNSGKEVADLVRQCLTMTNELLNLCDYPIDDDKKSLTMKDFKRLAELGNSPLIIPLQESLTASLPPTSSAESNHQPFPSNAPTFAKFFDEIEIMRSLAKPRKITIKGSNGQIYMFLGKPKDDLRKDARLMDFNAIINKLLKANSESRRRQLHIRTYGVVTLNEECGFIQWVPNTIPIRPVLVKYYEARRIRSWTSEMSDLFNRIKVAKDKDAADIYLRKILPMFPPVFHDWFIETFPEPTAWLASRMAYGRTAAVMSMVGFILGLGDRHCENILLDSITGDVVHVDFNCLFEKGKTLETPERVPFRLTQNMIDGLGVTGVEGVFRIACEVTMQLLRDHKDSLMSVLDAFIHDPLVEWEDEKRKLEREPTRRNQVKPSVDLRMLAKNALNPIEKKLKGIYSTSKERQEKEISTSNLVQMLIQEATDPCNLAKMYPGWAPWH
ncbi:Serine/threonine-protein kinase atr [Termitomyces sp. J132]|nr:Serine/threonine-protein kinase atr [Termitomyces sp. J132]